MVNRITEERLKYTSLLLIYYTKEEINKNGKPFLIDVFQEYSSGVRKGEIVDVNEVLIPLEKIGLFVNSLNKILNSSKLKKINT